MDALSALGTLLALPALAGINAYATVLTVGLLLRSGLLTHPIFADPAFAVLASDWVIGLAAVLYVLEFLADKVPAVDHIWDLVHTFIRPPIGAALALAGMGALDPDAGLPVLVGAALLGGSAAAATHLAKTTTRLVASNLSFGSTNWILSLLEDLTAVGGAWLALIVPAAAGVLAVVFLVLFVAFFPRVIRTLVALARKAASATRALGRPRADAGGDALREALPIDVEAAFAAAGGRGAVEVALPVLLGRLGSRGGGWLVATPSHVGCLGRRWRGLRATVVPAAEVGAPRVERGVLSDALLLPTPGGLWRVTLLREPGRSPEAVAARLASLAARARSWTPMPPVASGRGA